MLDPVDYRGWGGKPGGVGRMLLLEKGLAIEWDFGIWFRWSVV